MLNYPHDKFLNKTLACKIVCVGESTLSYVFKEQKSHKME